MSSTMPDHGTVQPPLEGAERARVGNAAASSGARTVPPGWGEARARTLRAVVARMIAGAPLGASEPDAVSAEVLRRLSSLATHKQRDLGRALDLLGSRVGGLASVGKGVAFADATPSLQDAWLSAWAHSALPPLRTAFQAFRRLSLGAHYGNPTVSSAIGHAGPLHLREAEVAWEGPLPASSVPGSAVHGSASSSSSDSTGSAAAHDSSVAYGTADLRRRLPPTVPPPGVIVGADITGPVHRTADAVVIGTGAGGAVAAARLAAAGLEVVILEDGGYYGAADFTETEVPLAERLYAEGALRATDDLGVQMLQGRSVGGSTTINWMIMLRTPEFVLEEWERGHGLADYGVRGMADAFERIEREVHARPVPDEAHSPNNRVILDGARALGWRASSAVINAQGCVRSGFCGIGCRYDAKQGTLRTYVPTALAHGATLYADARADRIEVRERDPGRGPLPRKRVHATVCDRISAAPRAALTIDTPLVVVAAGAVGTPVLLQRSGMGGGGVGQFLRLHPTTATIGLFDREIVGSAGIPLSTMCDEHIRWQHTNHGFWLECPPFLPALGAVAVPGFGESHAGLMRQFRRMSSVIALTRDGADTARSSGGVRARRDGSVSIRYTLTDADARRVRASIAAAARLQLAAGAREVHTLHTTPLVIRGETDVLAIERASVRANRVGLFSAHVNGTCRLGTDKRLAGTTPDGERFGARGVYVCDGSLLPTALGVNPQATIMALATIVADRLAARFGSGARPS